MSELPPFTLDAGGYDAYYTSNGGVPALADMDVQNFGYPSAPDDTLGWALPELPAAQPQAVQQAPVDPPLAVMPQPAPYVPQLQAAQPAQVGPAPAAWQQPVLYAAQPQVAQQAPVDPLLAGWARPLQNYAPQLVQAAPPPAPELMNFERFAVTNMNATWVADPNTGLAYLPVVHQYPYQAAPGPSMLLPQPTVAVPTLPGQGAIAAPGLALSIPAQPALPNTPQPSRSAPKKKLTVAGSAKKAKVAGAPTWQKMLSFKERVEPAVAQAMYDESVALNPNNNICPFASCGQVSEGRRRLHYRHVLSHAKLGTFLCPWCNKKASRQDILDSHMRRQCPNRPA